MKMDGIEGAILTALDQSSSARETGSSSSSNQTGFLDVLSAAMQDVNTAQLDASQSGTNLALGEESYLHNTMISYEKANLSLQLLLEVRNRLVEAYQEIMRIQV